MKPAARSGDDGSHTPDHGLPPRMPRWVKVFGIIAGIVILLLIAVKLLIGGQHGPGRHLHRSDASAVRPVDSA